MSGRAVLVTGGAGYIGAHVAKALRGQGHTPVVLDDLSMGRRDAVRWGPFFAGDVADAGLVRHIVEAEGVEAVVHLAGRASVEESLRDPRRYFRVNTAATVALLDALLDAGVRDFVFSSTCATYGVPRRLPLTEAHPQEPVSPYGESKLFVEAVLARYAAAYGMRVAVLRYFNAAGADPDGEIGECHTPETHLVPLALRAAAGTGGALGVNGVDYPTPDGTAVRDFVHVTDLASAHVGALDYLDGGGGELLVCNLGTGTGHGVREVVAAVEAVTGTPVPTVDAPRRRGDPPVLVADGALAHRVLGWEPVLSDLDTIVATAWAWETGVRTGRGAGREEALTPAGPPRPR